MEGVGRSPSISLSWLDLNIYGKRLKVCFLPSHISQTLLGRSFFLFSWCILQTVRLHCTCPFSTLATTAAATWLKKEKFIQKILENFSSNKFSAILGARKWHLNFKWLIEKENVATFVVLRGVWEDWRAIYRLIVSIKCRWGLKGSPVVTMTLMLQWFVRFEPVCGIAANRLPSMRWRECHCPGKCHG